MTSYFTFDFSGSFRHRGRNWMICLRNPEELFVFRSMWFYGKIIISKLHPIWSNLDLFDLDLTWPPPVLVEWHHMVKCSSLSIRTYKMIQKHTCRTAWLWFRWFFVIGRPWPRLCLHRRTHTVFFLIYTSTLPQNIGWIWPICSRCNRLEGPECEHALFWPLTDISLTRDLNLKMLSMG